MNHRYSSEGSALVRKILFIFKFLGDIWWCPDLFSSIAGCVCWAVNTVWDIVELYHYHIGICIVNAKILRCSHPPPIASVTSASGFGHWCWVIRSDSKLIPKVQAKVGSGSAVVLRFTFSLCTVSSIVIYTDTKVCPYKSTVVEVI